MRRLFSFSNLVFLLRRHCVLKFLRGAWGLSREKAGARKSRTISQHIRNTAFSYFLIFNSWQRNRQKKKSNLYIGDGRRHNSQGMGGATWTTEKEYVFNSSCWLLAKILVDILLRSNLHFWNWYEKTDFFMPRSPYLKKKKFSSLRRDNEYFSRTWKVKSARNRSIYRRKNFLKRF